MAHSSIEPSRSLLYRSVYWLVKGAIWLIAEVDVEKLELEPKVGEGLIIATNHRSYIDIFVLLIVLRKWGISPHVFVREDFLRLPVIGHVLRSMRAIPATTRAARQARELLRAGSIVVLAPEGGVPRPEDRIDGVGELKSGVGHMAAKLGTPILLVGAVNTDVAWPRDRPFPKIGVLSGSRPIVRVATQYVAVRRGADPGDVVREVRNGLVNILTRLEQRG